MCTKKDQKINVLKSLQSLFYFGKMGQLGEFLKSTILIFHIPLRNRYNYGHW